MRHVRGQAVPVFEKVPTERAGDIGLILVVVSYEVLLHVTRVSGDLITKIAYPATPSHFLRVGPQENIQTYT